MPVDRSYTAQVRKLVLECEFCGRVFRSDGNWAVHAVRMCEEECETAQERGEIRVFFPPPGRWDTMFRDTKWIFVPKGDPRVKCAREGHVESKSWGDVYSSRIGTIMDRGTGVTVKDARHEAREEWTSCSHCGAGARELHNRRQVRWPGEGDDAWRHPNDLGRHPEVLAAQKAGTHDKAS